jgi:hypothetical protein
MVPLGHQTRRSTCSARTGGALENCCAPSSKAVRRGTPRTVIESAHDYATARKRKAQSYGITLVHIVRDSRQDWVACRPVRVEDLPDKMESGNVAGSRSQRPVVGQPYLIPVATIGEPVQKIRWTETGTVGLRNSAHVKAQ